MNESQSTPVSRLPPPNEDQDPNTNRMLQNIMDEVQDQEEQFQQDQQYQPQSQQMPIAHQQPVMDPGYYQQQQSQQQQSQQLPVQQEQFSPTAIPEVPQQSQLKTWGDFAFNESKGSLLFTSLFILLSTPAVVRILSRYIPWMVNTETGTATTTGLIIRALIGAIVFYVIKKSAF